MPKNIQLTKGYVAIIDDEDFERVSKIKWHVHTVNDPLKPPYASGYLKKPYRLVLLHRFIMNPPKDLQIDHINGNSLDNRKSNLRVCTANQNKANHKKHRNSKSRFIGVCPNSGGDKRKDGTRWINKKHPWKAVCRHFVIGTFKTEEEAARAYDVKAREFHGEFARTNF